MSAFEDALTQHSRVFISYSHDSAAHCDRVLDLAQQLRRDGINTELDQFHQDELLHWPRWCEEQLRPEKADFVLCICTIEYKRRIEGQVPADVGKGVFWEGTLIYNYLYDAKGSKRFLPVLLDKNARDIPSILGGYTRFELDVFGLENLQSEYSKLYRLLTRQPARLMTEIGALQKLPPLPPKARRTDFILLIQEAIASIKKTESNTEEILAILKGRAVPASTAQRPHNLPPWMSSDYFIGRGEELQKLMSGLTTSDKTAVAQPQVIHGGGGTGKSRLAIQVAWLLYVQEKCDMAFFVSADTPSMLDTKLVELDGGSFLNLYEDAEPPKELGRVVRTIFLLQYVSDLELRQLIQAATNKSEAFNKFVQWVCFGGEGVIAENVRDEQRKFIKYNHLVANLLSFHTLVTMTKALQQLLEEGDPVDMEALSTLSPYRTEHINRFGNYVINPDRMPEPLEQHLRFSLSPVST